MIKELQSHNYVFFISTGRTGTKYFGDLCSNIVRNSFSVHEPDVLNLKDFWGTISKIRNFGLYHMLIGRVFGKTGVRNLSQMYIAGTININELKKKIVEHRGAYYLAIEESLIIESYSGWYACIPALTELLPQCKIVIILRDPMTWAISTMRWGTVYGERDYATRLIGERLNPFMVKDEIGMKYWTNWGQFEKTIWFYNYINTLLIEDNELSSNIKIFRYEDIFFNKSHIHFYELIKFISIFPQKSYDWKIMPGMIEHRVHSSNNDNDIISRVNTAKNKAFISQILNEKLKTWYPDYAINK